MTDEFEIASGQVAGTEWNGKIFTALALRVEADTPEQAHDRVRAFLAEAGELAEAHPGVAITFEVEETYPTFKRAIEVLEKLVAQIVAERAQRQ